MSRTVGDYLGLDRAGVGHGLRLALAAWLAFSLASLLHVENAYWAAMPVWVVTQNLRGLLIERAVFRVLGTLVGAGVGFAIVQLPLGPYAMLVLLASWVAFAAGMTHIIRGVHSYGALMAGMTAAVVLLPSVLLAETSLDIAVARVECTLIGVVVLTLVTGFMTPQSRRQAFYLRARRLAGEAVGHAAELLRTGTDRLADDREGRFIAEVSEVEATARLVSAGSVEGYRRLRHVDALVVASLSVVAAGMAWSNALRRAGRQPDPAVIEPLDALARRLNAPSDEGVYGVGLVVQGADGSRVSLRLIDSVESLVQAAAALEADPADADARSFGAKLTYLAPHREWGLAWRTGAVTGMVALVASMFGYWSGSALAELSVLAVCIFSMVLGSMAMPQQIAPHMLKGVVVGMVAAMLYRLLLQPHVDTTAELVFSVVPFLLLGGLARAATRTALASIDANMVFLLAGQAVLPAVALDLGRVLQGALAMLAAAAVVTVSFMLMPRRPETQAIDAADNIRRDLQRLARRQPSTEAEWQAQTSRQILRLALHLGRAQALSKHLPTGLLAALNLGHAMAELGDLACGVGLQADACSEERALAGQAMALLEIPHEDPVGTSAALRTLAATADQARLADVIEDVAASLRESTTTLRFGL
ncbi:MAG: FUSC family protein [Lysobacter sp.]